MIREGQQGESLAEKIATRRARVGIIGMGYVGLPLGIAFAKAGFPTFGLDVDPQRVEVLRRGESPIRHIPHETVAEVVGDRRLQVTPDLGELARCDAILICVPTPLNESREPDLGYVRASAEAIAGVLRRGQLVILESTTYPGTTEDLVRPTLEAGGLRVGEDFHLAYSPEREGPANAVYRTGNIPKLVAGVTEACRDRAVALYEAIVERVVPVSDCKVAEMAKLLENIYRCVNIALVNELKILCDRMGTDVWEVIDAAATKPFGFSAFYPGPGLGGHCIPVDPFYLTWKARQHDFATRFIELAGEINTNMPHYVVQRAVEALNEEGKSVKDAELLVLGVAYKKDIEDLRMSPALRVMELLEDRGAKVRYHDPYVPEAVWRHGGAERRWSGVPLDAALLREMDAVLILTDHGAVDYAQVVRESRLVLDTRNATKGLAPARARVVKA
jgi:UDP-N-acetyl-D-glucosamine dehydrogenase